MEDNVALESSKQKQFVKSIRGIKKLIKRTADDPENVEPKSKNDKKSKKQRPERGLVYLSHIPHGFYEHEMTQYFKQFGAVSNVRVIRSKKTGNSKGFAFVEFKQPAVAEIVAETMNNYLMGKRLLKAAYVPPEKQKRGAMRKHWSRTNNPGRTEKLKQKKAYNTDKDEEAELKKAKKTLANFNKNMKKLSELGINYDFFTPVDVPEGLSVAENPYQTIVTENKSVKEAVPNSKQKHKNIKEEIKKPVKASTVDVKESRKKPEPVVNQKEQTKKQQKLKDAGVKLPENFMKLNDEAEDSDSSAGFDSDDFSKMLENESDADSGEQSEEDSDDDEETEELGPGESDEFEITGSDDDESDGDDESDEEILPPLEKGKSKGPVVPQLVPTRKQANKKGSKVPDLTGPKGPLHPKGPKGPVQKNASEQVKRKAPEKIAVSPKKPKFEKQTQQPMKKQFKKKK